MSTEVCLRDEQDFYAAIADVRSDGSDTTWALFGHVDYNPNEIQYLASGTGDAEEMIEWIKDDESMYALVRLVETFDLSTTVKFAYIRWDGKDVPFTKKGKFGVVHGSIEKYFDPYHVMLEFDSPDDLTSENIRTKIQETSGTRSKVLDVAEAQQRPERGFTSGTTTKADSTGSTPTQRAHLSKISKLGSSFSGMSTQSKGSGALPIEDEATEAIADVHSDVTETNWCACGYRDGNVKKPNICLLGSGCEGLEELRKFLADDNVVYALYRATDVVDDIPTVKFVYIQWVGESTKPLTKAKITPHKGAMEDAFYPTHVTIFATTPSEINQRVVMDKVTTASGSKSHVK